MIGERIKKLRAECQLTQRELAEKLGLTPKMISFYELGERFPPNDILIKLSKIFNVSSDYILGISEQIRVMNQEEICYFDIIGSISAGFNTLLLEDYTGEKEPIPKEALHGNSPDDFFVLKVKGNSMYPKFLGGDKVLVYRCASVDSGSIAVILYNGEEATLKKVRYVPGQDWVELIPINPEYETKRIEGAELEQCRVLGKVVKLIRDI